MRHQQPCPTPYISRDLDPCSTLASRAPLAAPPQFLGFLAEEEAEEEGEAASIVSSLGLLDEEGGARGRSRSRIPRLRQLRQAPSTRRPRRLDHRAATRLEL